MQRTFILGDEWLYYKLYCGSRTADHFLVEAIKPLTEKLLADKLIDKWFFIRYADPKPHLRIRFHCSDLGNLGAIIDEVKMAINYYILNDLIWKVEIGTYQRELERYGADNMIASEKLFFVDSEICINALELIEDDELLFLFALKAVDNILNIFDLSSKLTFVKKNSQAFKNEFNSNKQLSKQLNKKYQELRKRIETFLISDAVAEYKPLLNLLDKNIHRFERLIGELAIDEKISQSELLSSYVHMTINRLFRDRQRLHELVCYDCLYRFYNFLDKRNLND